MNINYLFFTYKIGKKYLLTSRYSILNGCELIEKYGQENAFRMILDLYNNPRNCISLVIICLYLLSIDII